MTTAETSDRSPQADRNTRTTLNAGKHGVGIEAPRYGLRFLEGRDQASLPIQRKKNGTGLPDALKTGVESLSGFSLDQVKVHYNSARPAELNAHAYAQGRDIHVAPGQERHLPHEAWHVVQQAQGRVVPTTQSGGVPINDDRRLEREADRMGSQASSLGRTALASHPAGGDLVTQGDFQSDFHPLLAPHSISRTIVQRQEYDSVGSAVFSPAISNEGLLEDVDLRARIKKERKALKPWLSWKEDTCLDARARANVVLEEVEKAYESFHRQNRDALRDRRTLLVFLGPEWMFTREENGAGVPYTEAERDVVAQVFRKASSDYRDMLIMPGTVVWERHGENGREIRNDAPVFLNGELIHCYGKRGNNGDAKNAHEFRPGTDPSLFKVGNLTFAIEICQDHYDKVAQKEIQAREELEWAGGVDVHLVTGSGQSPQRDRLAARKGGWFIGSDAAGGRPAFGSVVDVEIDSGERSTEDRMPAYKRDMGLKAKEVKTKLKRAQRDRDAFLVTEDIRDANRCFTSHAMTSVYQDVVPMRPSSEMSLVSLEEESGDDYVELEPSIASQERSNNNSNNDPPRPVLQVVNARTHQVVEERKLGH